MQHLILLLTVVVALNGAVSDRLPYASLHPGTSAIEDFSRERDSSRTRASVISEVRHRMSNGAINRYHIHNTKDAKQRKQRVAATPPITTEHQLADEAESVALTKAKMREHPRVTRFWRKMLWLIGIAITLFGQTIMVPGLLLQKMAHVAVEKRSAEEKQSGRPYWMDWRWILGTCIWLFSHVFCWIGLGMAPQCTVACLQCWNMVVVMMLAPVMLNETVPQNAWTYGWILGCGCICVILFGPGHYSTMTMGEIGSDVKHAAVFSPMMVLVAVYFATEVAKYYKVRVPEAYLYMLCSAVCAWYSATLSKCTASLLVTTVVTSSNQIKLGLLALLVAFVAMAIGQLHFMNMALRYGDAVLVIPTYECMSMLGQILFAGFLFHEFKGLPSFDAVGFGFGVICVVCGLLALTQDNVSMAVKVMNDRSEQGDSKFDTPASAPESAHEIP